MTIINREQPFIYLKSRKTASSSIEIHLILNTECGQDIFATSREILRFGRNRAQRHRALVPGLIKGWYTPQRFENCIRGHVRGGGRLLPVLNQHDPARRVRRMIGGRFFDRAIKAVPVRNPWDAVVSYYEWERSGGQGRTKQVDLPWAAWLANKLEPAPKGKKISIAEQFLFDDWLNIRGSPVECCFIYFEDIEASLEALASALKLSSDKFSEMPFHFKKAGRVSDYRHYFTDQQAGAVAQAFQGYLQRTGYRYDRPGLAP